jgi:hypothetical protein
VLTLPAIAVPGVQRPAQYLVRLTCTTGESSW